MRRPGRGALAGGLAAALLAAALPIAGCGADPGRWQEETRGRAASAIVADLEDVLARTSAAAGDLERALAATPPEPGRRLAALEALRARHGVDGLLWEGPGGETAWAGRPLEPTGTAWPGSFRTGDVAWHEGPYLRAVLFGPVPAHGGFVTVTSIIEERTPEDAWRPFAHRWLDPLALEAVRIVPPAPDGAGVVARVPPGANALGVEIDVPGAEAAADRLLGARRARVGHLLVAGWLVLATALLLLVCRSRRLGAGRLALGAGVALLLRSLLGWIDLPGRFPGLRAAFDPTDFGVDDPLGWLASPGDLALTALAFLGAAACLGRLPGPAPARRAPAVGAVLLLAGTAAAAVVGSAWAHLVALAVAQSRTVFFETPSFVPPLPAALMLLGLVVATAAAWLLALAALRRATDAAGARRTLVGLVAALAAAAAGAALASATRTPWAAALLPLAAFPFLRRDTAGGLGGLPSRILLTGVLATLLLFPPLWVHVEDRSAQGLEVVLDTLLRGEATARGGARQDLEALGDDGDLRAVLEGSARGPRPDGLALEVWRRTFLAQPEEQGLLSVLGPDGRLLDEFSLTPIPRALVPAPAPPTRDAGDLQIVTARGEGGALRSVVGRLRVRGPDGEPLGAVVMTVPDRVDLAILGLRPIGGGDGGAPPGPDPLTLAVAVLRQGRVVASSDPAASRQPGGFGPRALADLGASSPTLSWREGGMEGRAVWSPERGAVIAVRRETAGVTEVVLALGRVLVVGVGASLVLAVLAFLTRLRGFRPRLQHRILLSYFTISFVPILMLGWTSAREVRQRHDERLAERLQTSIGRARADLEAMGGQIWDRASTPNLVAWAAQRHHDTLLYRDGVVVAASRPGLVEAELLPSRLPADAWQATVVESREIVRREASFAGQPVWFGYAPVLDASGRTLATVGVPLLYDKDRVQERMAVTGSILLGAYLLTLVFVLVGGIVTAGRLTRPLGLVAAGARRVAAGDLDVEIPGGGSDELGDLVRAFNAMTRELRDVTARAVRAERETAWRRMARQVAHEIKNPLTPMRLMIQQMLADVERDPARAEEAIRRTAAVVLQQIETLGRIAGDFATFARLPRRHPTSLDARALVDHVVGLYAGSAQEGVRIEGVVEPGLPPIHGDEGEMRRVLVNLVGNAVQALRDGGHVAVRARAASRGGRPGVLLIVEDDGVGIAPEDVGRLFEPDFSTKTGGTGLGLAIVRRTLDDMGGAIEVESEPGQGSTFRVWCPAPGGEEPHGGA